MIAALGAAQVLWVSTCAAQSPFATRVLEYTPSPGQNVSNPQFNDPARALGAPVGGGVLAADNSKVVTLGGFGGSITLGFDHSIIDRPPTATNPTGADLIVFGNAFWAGGNPDLRWAEPGVIEVSRDDNGNGLADDAWYVIRGTQLPEQPQSAFTTVTLNTGIERSGYLLTDPLFNSVVLMNPAGEGMQGVYGYADCSPTMVLGDFDGDGLPDRGGVDPAWFFTVPSDPRSTVISTFSGGGDAVDIASAVRPDGTLAGLDRVDFVRIRTGVNIVRNVLGEVSTELSGVAEVRARQRADIGGAGGLLGPDGRLDNNDFIAFIDLFFHQSVLADIGGAGGLPGSDGAWNNNDFIVFITWFFSGE
ncbi:MAG: GC-type dockerin domain-anchored protein [Phycisphaerales bacterium]